MIIEFIRFSEMLLFLTLSYNGRKPALTFHMKFGTNIKTHKLK